MYINNPYIMVGDVIRIDKPNKYYNNLIRINI